MKTVIAVSTAAMVLGGLLLPASVNAQLDFPCHHLFLLLPKDCSITEVRCLKGRVVYQEGIRADFVQDDLDGPECQVTVRNDYGLFRSEFTVKQKFCFLKAGDISMTHTGGARPVCDIYEGKFTNKSGSIIVKSFDHQ